MFTNDFYEDFFNFGKVMDLAFNTGNTKDMNPAYWSKTEDGYKATCRTVGIAPEDVKVDFVNSKIIVEGKTECEGDLYETKYKIPVSYVVASNIEKINYKTLNGMTYIYIRLKEPKQNEILIEKN